MLFCSSVEKWNTNTPVGLQFWMTPNSSIIIINVDKHGLFAGRLKVGMHVEKVNDVFIGDRHGRGSIVTVAALQEYLAQLTGTVTIWAGDGSAHHHHHRLLQQTSSQECLWDTKKSPQQDSVMKESPRPSLVEVSDFGSSDFSSCSGRYGDGGDEPSSLTEYDDDEMDKKIIESLFHRTTG